MLIERLSMRARACSAPTLAARASAALTAMSATRSSERSLQGFRCGSATPIRCFGRCDEWHIDIVEVIAREVT